MVFSTTLDAFYNFLFILALVGLVVFITLFFVDAGYGKMRTEKWGPAINNKVGWFLMEMPVFAFLWQKDLFWRFWHFLSSLWRRPAVIIRMVRIMSLTAVR